MINMSLLKFCNPEVFKLFPKLKEIWRPELAKEMQEVTVADIKDDPDSNIYLIMVDDEVVGITGFYTIDECCVGLRWHGVILEYRNKGYSKEAINQLMKLIEEIHPHALGVVEFAEENPPYVYHILHHFKALGFEERPFRGFTQSEISQYVPDTGKDWFPLIRYINGYDHLMAGREYSRRKNRSSITSPSRTHVRIASGVGAALAIISKDFNSLYLSEHTPPKLYDRETTFKSKPYLKKKKRPFIRKDLL